MKRQRSATFKEICDQARPKTLQRLAEKASNANRIAKITVSATCKSSAYRAKDAALNQGIRLGFFKPRSDEAGRSHLLSIACRNRQHLHMPIHRLSSDSLEHIHTKTVLGHHAQHAA